MRKTLISGLFLCSSLLTCWTQDLRFLSKTLQQIAQAEGVSIPMYRGNQVELSSYNKDGHSYPIVVEFLPEGVSHIGLDLFNQDVKNENPIILRFVERYLLELITLYPPTKTKRVMSIDGVSMTGDIRALFNVNPDSLRIDYTTNASCGSVFLSVADKAPFFSIAFPLSISLLSGMDKHELDSLFINGICSSSLFRAQTIPYNLSRIGENLYVSENGFYELPSIQNSSFFRKQSHLYYPVCDSKHPKESVLTLLSAHTGSKNYIVHLTYHTYNYSQIQVDVPLTQLLGFCLDNGCTPYIGIEQCGDLRILATLFMLNEGLGYCHTFSFYIDKAVLDKDNGTFDAHVYSFTPIHNLSK